MANPQALPPLLDYLYEFLTVAGNPAILDPPAENKPFRNLLIWIGEEAGNDDWARLYFTTDVLTELGHQAIEAFEVLDLTLPLGIPVPDQRRQKVSFLLAMLNRLLPGPVLLYNQADGIFFKISYLLQDKEDFWPGLLLESLSLLRYFLPRLRRSIREVAEGLKKVDEAMAEIEKALATPPEGAGPLIHVETADENSKA